LHGSETLVMVVPAEMIRQCRVCAQPEQAKSAAPSAQREQITDEEELIVDKVGVPLIFLGMAFLLFVILPMQSIIH